MKSIIIILLLKKLDSLIKEKIIVKISNKLQEINLIIRNRMNNYRVKKAKILKRVIIIKFKLINLLLNLLGISRNTEDYIF